MPASGTANRGVEAKEYEIADTVLENSLGGSQGRDSVARASSTHTHTVDETSSYIQVVVQKQRRGGRGARLPAASSPAPEPYKLRKAEADMSEEGGGECGDDTTLLVLPARPPLLLLPPLALAAMSPAPLRHAHEYVRKDFTQCEDRARGAGGGDAAPPRAGLRGKTKSKSSWKLFSLNGENLDSSDCGPEGFEVYYFESAEACHLATCGGARPTRVERGVRSARRRAAALLRELLAAASLLPAAPAALLLALLRCGLEMVRSVVGGALQTASDFGLKPALALLHNALLQPPLVCAASAARGVRAALQPVFAALGDAVDPLARVLSAVRFVHVHIERAPGPCSCGRGAKDDSNV